MRGAIAKVALLTTFILLHAPIAQAAGKRVGVPKFEGAQEALVRKKVMAVLKAHGFELVRSRQMEDAISSTGASLDSDEGLAKLAKELSLSAIVTGEVGPKRAKIAVHNGADGSSLADASFSGANPRKLANEVGLTFWKKLGPDVGHGHVPSGAKRPQKSAEVSPEDDENAPEGGNAGGGEAAAPKAKDETAAEESNAEEAPPPPRKKKSKVKMEEAPPEETAEAPVKAGRSWLDFEAGIGGLHRTLMFNDNVQMGGSGILFLPYTLPVGPVGVANVVIYPLDPLVGGPLGNLGGEVEIQQGFAISSTANNSSGSATYGNVVHDYAGGLRYRVVFGTGSDVYFSATAGEDAFTFTGGTASFPRSKLFIPDTIYHYARPGLGVHLVSTHGLTLRLAAGYRYVFNGAGPQLSGSPNGLFPHLTVGGADAEIVGGYRITPMFEVRLGLEWRRYWFAMHSVPTDMNFAGGLTDQSFTFTARIALLLGSSNVPTTEGGAEEPPTPPPPNQSRGRKSEEESGGSDSEGPPPSGDNDSGGKTGGDIGE